MKLLQEINAKLLQDIWKSNLEVDLIRRLGALDEKVNHLSDRLNQENDKLQKLITEHEIQLHELKLSTDAFKSEKEIEVKSSQKKLKIIELKVSRASNKQAESNDAWHRMITL